MKRVIALPDEHLAIVGPIVYINGTPLKEPYAHSKIMETPPLQGQVPEGTVWVMGDNRTQSKDSRYFNSIPESKIVGRAFFRVWPPGRIGAL